MANLEWTTAPPTVDGWYWARWAGFSRADPRFVPAGTPMTGDTGQRVEMVHVRFWRGVSPYPEDQDGFEIIAPQQEGSVYGFEAFDYWLGPITPPEPPE